MMGQTIRMDGVPITVIGVTPAGIYLGDERADFWNPFQFNRLVVGSTGFTMGVVARLRPGGALRQAQSELDVISAQQLAADPDHNKGLGARVQPMTESLYGDLQEPLLILQGTCRSPARIPQAERNLTRPFGVGIHGVNHHSDGPGLRHRPGDSSFDARSG